MVYVTQLKKNERPVIEVKSEDKPKRKTRKTKSE